MNLKKMVKREIFITGFSVVFLALGFLLLSYAVFMQVDEGDVNTIQFGDLAMTFTNSTNAIQRNADNPMTDAQGQATTPYTFTIKNTGTIPMRYKVKLVPDTEYISTNSLSSEIVNYSDIKISIDAGTPKIFSSLVDGEVITGMLQPSASVTYNLRVWLKSDASNDSINKRFITLISAEGEYTPDLN